MISIKTKSEIERMRQSGQILAEVFEIMEKNIKPGVSTKHLDKLAHDYILSQNATPSFLRYNGFPASICTSVDEYVVHGIPSDSCILQEGMIIGVDVGVNYKGMHTDAARTYAVGKISKEKQQLIEVTKQSFFEGIKYLKDGSRVGDIGARIQRYAEKFGYGVVRDLVGHGVGKCLHEDPSIPNFGREGTGVKLQSGMTIAIEPMINMGDYHVQFDGMWKVWSADRSPSAHYENTVLIKDDGVEILTIKQEDKDVE